MDTTKDTTPAEGAEAETTPKKKEEGSFAVFLLKLIVVVLIFRTFVFATFSIPSESMLPRLMVGDYLFTAKWPYGYSQASMPFDIELWDGRVPDALPDRGDVVVFKHPVDRQDYIKRVIGLPGDTVQMRGGQLFLNGEAIPKQRIANFEVEASPNTLCRDQRFVELRGGTTICSYPQFKETLPGGRSYNVLDFGADTGLNRWGVNPDETTPQIVPEGHVFVMGDNRDSSLDSRFPAEADFGVGYLPAENIVGRASFIAFSTDGSASWIKPWTWFTAARGSRIGDGL
ncbi:signal peptidase I [Paraurantiacibacter namhicola]|uniref:Signal peptidase I n=1 Tax=Paraurantiacibacter namhicola TaxID=645517 RepID=A0A1C7D9R1_9SPHN|nr:signal peptidase I [Paraurantiacibacter namhicola]ANU08204.1 Signal peptidase I [Paraurantiacibacter namhicola]